MNPLSAAILTSVADDCKRHRDAGRSAARGTDTSPRAKGTLTSIPEIKIRADVTRSRTGARDSPVAIDRTELFRY